MTENNIRDKSGKYMLCCISLLMCYNFQKAVCQVRLFFATQAHGASDPLWFPIPVSTGAGPQPSRMGRQEGMFQHRRLAGKNPIVLL